MTKQDSINIVAEALWYKSRDDVNMSITFEHILKACESLRVLRIINFDLLKKQNDKPNIQTKVYIEKVQDKIAKLENKL